MVKVLFVCMGNICRSPAAEGALKKLIQTHQLHDKIMCESAGTSGYHVGETPDERMRQHAARRDLVLDSLAQQFQYEHFKKFDYIITMDGSNFKNVMRLDPEGQFKSKVIPMSHLCIECSITDVPDPYYGGGAGFEEVLDIVQDGCLGLLERLNLLPSRL
jgi:protein-tyrosine phosphatase